MTFVQALTLPDSAWTVEGPLQISDWISLWYYYDKDARTSGQTGTSSLSVVVVIIINILSVEGQLKKLNFVYLVVLIW